MNEYFTINVKGKQKLLHRYIVELHIGRELRSDEIVHHKNGDKKDNQLENLEILTSVKEHMQKHIEISRQKKVFQENVKKWEEDKKKVIEMVLEGHLYSEIMEETGLGRGSIAGIIKRNNLSNHPQRLEAWRQRLNTPWQTAWSMLYLDHMAQVIYRRKKKEVNQSLIPNTQLEQMFLSICDDSQMEEYTRLIEKGLIHTASAYASQRVLRTFQYWRDSFIKNGGDLDYLQFMLWRSSKK